MGEHPYSLSAQKIKDVAEILGKLLFSAIGVCYVTGLCVVNIYLNNYGIYSLGLLRVNYITAGVWAMLPILVSFVTIYGVVGLVQTFRRDKDAVPQNALPSEKIKGTFIGRDVISWSMLANFLLLAALLIVLSSLLGIELSRKWLLALVTGCFVVLSLLSVYRTLIAPAVSGGLKRYVYLGSILVMAIFILFLHILVFANRVYGTIPSYIGGGGAKRVQIIFDSKIPKFLMGPGTVSEEDPHQSKEVLLLFATDQEYILVVSQSEMKEIPISIRRDTVKMILYR